MHTDCGQGSLDYGAEEIARILSWYRRIGECQPNNVKRNIAACRTLLSLALVGCAVQRSSISRAGAFYDYFMSVAFWMRPFFTDFCRYGENRKAVDNEWIVRDSAGFKGMSISAFYALQNQCTGDELVGGFDSRALPP